MTKIITEYTTFKTSKEFKEWQEKNLNYIVIGIIALSKDKLFNSSKSDMIKGIFVQYYDATQMIYNIETAIQQNEKEIVWN